MAVVHLMSGLPCSGKSTHAAALQAKSDCVLISLDRWLITSFGKYSIASVGHDEHARRVLACRELIWDSASEFLHRSVDVILDDGFFLRADRMRAVERARAAGVTASIHFMNTPVALLRTRLERRNANLPSFNFHIDPNTLEGFLGLFEVPSADEGAEVLIVEHVAPLASRVG